MSLHRVFVAMETFQADFVDAMAGWLSWADLNGATEATFECHCCILS